MEKVFVTTENYQEFNDICDELRDPDGLVGPTLALVTGRAGRGKTEAARYHAVQTSAVYVRTLPVMTPLMVLREIAFELAALKPRTTASCLEIIEEEMARERRIVLVDEADLVPMKVLETLRGINERCGCPVVLIGEEELAARVAGRRRIVSRIRRRMEFRPLSQADLALFYAKAMGLKLSPGTAAVLHGRAGGDWRPAVTAAIAIERAVKASGLDHVPEELAREVAR